MTNQIDQLMALADAYRYGWYRNPAEVKVAQDALRTALEAALKPGEPVAWRIHPSDAGIGHEGLYAMTDSQEQVAIWERKGWAIEPLYAAAQPIAMKPVEPSLNYEPVFEFASKHQVSYNELCVLVRAACAAPPAQLEGGPAGSGGWEKHAIEMERQRDHYRQRCQTMHEHKDGEVWYWQGDGGDHLESMSHGMLVVIRADQLRELSAPPAQTPPPRLTVKEIRDEVDVEFDWHKGWTVDENSKNRYLNLARAIETAVRAQFGVNDE